MAGRALSEATVSILEHKQLDGQPSNSARCPECGRKPYPQEVIIGFSDALIKAVTTGPSQSTRVTGVDPVGNVHWEPVGGTSSTEDIGRYYVAHLQEGKNIKDGVVRDETWRGRPGWCRPCRDATGADT